MTVDAFERLKVGDDIMVKEYANQTGKEKWIPAEVLKVIPSDDGKTFLSTGARIMAIANVNGWYQQIFPETTEKKFYSAK